MNSSVVFEFVSRRDPLKIYKLLVFSNGMAKIAGVNECYILSEVPQMVSTATSVLKACFGISNAVECSDVKVAMCNYVCEFPIGSSMLDIPRTFKKYITSPEIVRKYAQDSDLDLISFKMPKVRNVIYAKLGLPKTDHAITF